MRPHFEVGTGLPFRWPQLHVCGSHFLKLSPIPSELPTCRVKGLLHRVASLGPKMIDDVMELVGEVEFEKSVAKNKDLP